MSTRNFAALSKKYHHSSACGEYIRFLTAPDIQAYLGLSRSQAYKIIQTGRLSRAQRELLDFKCFGLIPGWNGWRIEPGYIVDPTGYRYTAGEIQSIPLLKSMV